MRFLIDECLSPTLVLIARQAGYEAQHLAHVGKAGWMDWNVADYAGDGDFILVTNNADDFRRIYALKPIHAGLVIIMPNVDMPEQQRLFRGALGQLQILGEPVNRVLEVDVENDDIVYTVYDLPSSTS